MADQSDVEAALAALVAGYLYPNGPASPSVVGFGCRIYRGWPQRLALEADVAVGVAHVGIVGEAAGQRTTTRFPDEWSVPAPTVPTLTATAVWGSVTYAGAASIGQLVGIRVSGVGYVHRTIAGDTPASVAAALAVIVPGASATAAVLSIPGLLPVARVTADQAGVRETRRQCQGFSVRCWTGVPSMRDVLAGAIDSALSAVDFVGLADGTAGRLRFVSSTLSDRARDAGLFRRDLLYSVDYATTLLAELPCLIFEGTVIHANGTISSDTVS